MSQFHDSNHPTDNSFGTAVYVLGQIAKTHDAGRIARRYVRQGAHPDLAAAFGVEAAKMLTASGAMATLWLICILRPTIRLGSALVHLLIGQPTMSAAGMIGHAAFVVVLHALCWQVWHGVWIWTRVAPWNRTPAQTRQSKGWRIIAPMVLVWPALIVLALAIPSESYEPQVPNVVSMNSTPSSTTIPGAK